MVSDSMIGAHARVRDDAAARIEGIGWCSDRGGGHGGVTRMHVRFAAWPDRCVANRAIAAANSAVPPNQFGRQVPRSLPG